MLARSHALTHTYTHVHAEQKSEEPNLFCESPTYKEWSGREVPVQYGKQQFSLVTAWPIKLSSAKGLQPEPAADALPVNTVTELWPLTPQPLLVGPDLQTQEEERVSCGICSWLGICQSQTVVFSHTAAVKANYFGRAKSCTFSRPLYFPSLALLSVSSLVFSCSSFMFTFSTSPQSLAAAVSFPASPRAEKEKQFLPSPVWACTAGKQTQLPCSLRAGAS